MTATGRTDSPDGREGAARASGWWWVAGYAALLVYGTLFPVWDWRWPPGPGWPFPQWPEHASRADILTNLIVYVPLGLAAGWRVDRRAGRGWFVVAVGLAGAGFSLALEGLQAFVPGRVPSLLDVVLNGVGTVVGAGGAVLFSPGTRTGGWLTDLRARLLIPGRLAVVGLWAPALWALGQLFPFVPSIDVGVLKHGLKPLYHTVVLGGPFSWARFFSYGLAVAGLGLFVSRLLRPGWRGRWAYLGFVGGVMALKVPVMGRQLSFEAVTGGVCGALAALTLWRLPGRLRGSVAAGLVAAAVLVDGLRAGSGGVLYEMAWVPFRAQMKGLGGLADLLAGAWPFYALGWLAGEGLAVERRGTVGLGGALVVFLVVLGVELAQRSLPGRVPDITDAVVAVAGWLTAWGATARGNGTPGAEKTLPGGIARG